MMIALSLLIGFIAGLRAMIAPAAVSWAARMHLLDLHGGWLAWLGYRFTPWILTVAALAELVTDQLPATPSRKVPPQFAVRIISGGLCGAAIMWPGGLWIEGSIAGGVGAVIGTLGGSAARSMLARNLGRDRPAAIIEDAVAVFGAIAVVALA